jgi:hypothetical protein
VSDTAELAHAVLLRVAEFVKKLPTDQLEDLARGEAKLEVVPKGGRPAARSRATAVSLPRPADEIVKTIREIDDRVAARRYLETDLKLTVPMLKQFASEVGITVSGNKGPILTGIVEWAVGRGVDADVISRVGAGR